MNADLTFPRPASFAGDGLTCIRGERAIFSGLTFQVEPGGALLLLGPNGAGKSSLLRLMALLLTPTAGRLTWAGQTVNDDPEAHGARARYIGHLDAIKPVLSLRENIAFWARVAGWGDRFVGEALDTFNLTSLAPVPGRMLSAGQKRRTNLARLIAAPAPLWLLDEPTTALDRASIGLLEEALARHRAKGGIVVLSTHQEVSLPDAQILRVDAFTPRAERAESLFWGDDL